MRRFIGPVLGAVVIGHLLTATVAGGGASPFKGVWTSTDRDGSAQLLIVSSGATPAVTFEDFYASACARFGGPSTHWVSAGQGSVDGDLLIVAFHRSGCGSFGIGAYEGYWTYQPAFDTLIDTDGIEWSRMK